MNFVVPLPESDLRAALGLVALEEFQTLDEVDLASLEFPGLFDGDASGEVDPAETPVAGLFISQQN